MDARGTAVVTGASRGIGRALAIALADRGFSVVAAMRTPEAVRNDIISARLDVTAPDDFAWPSDLRVLVNNAGVQQSYHPVETLPLGELRTMLETNLVGAIAMTQRAIPLMRANGGGVIVNISSSSVYAPAAFFAAYRASKAALSAVSESLATEIAPFGIRVLDVVPGPVDTDGLRRSETTPASEDPNYAELAAQMAARRPLIDAMKVSAASVAERIVADVLDDDAHGRRSCDPMSDRLVATNGGKSR